MKYRIEIRGVIIPNSYKWYYSFFGEEATCPLDVSTVLNKLNAGDEVEIYINSPGGVIDAGSEIYTLIRSATESHDVRIYILGQAHSAASVIACAAYCAMAPTALMMVHCVSSGINGNHSDMEHMAEILRTADRALCTAYTAKSGMDEEEALSMMESETWLTAAQAKERGLVDEVMFESAGEGSPLTAGPLFSLPTEEQMQKVKEMLKLEQDAKEAEETELQECRKRYLELDYHGLENCIGKEEQNE